MTGLFVIFSESGRIQKVFTGQEEEASYQGFGFAPCGPDISDETHYVDLSEDQLKIVERKAMEISEAHGELSVTLEGIPYGSLVSIESSETVAGSQPTEIEFDAPGTYEIRIYPPPQYRDEVLEVTIG